MPKTKGNLIGASAFLIGAILSIILGALSMITPAIALILVILGLIVGLLNVGDEEVTPFLLAAVSLVIVSSFGASALTVVPVVSRMLQALLILFVPATVIVAVKEVFSIARV